MWKVKKENQFELIKHLLEKTRVFHSFSFFFGKMENFFFFFWKTYNKNWMKNFPIVGEKCYSILITEFDFFFLLLLFSRKLNLNFSFYFYDKVLSDKETDVLCCEFCLGNCWLGKWRLDIEELRLKTILGLNFWDANCVYIKKLWFQLHTSKK